MDGEVWWAAVHGVAKSRRRLSDFPFTFHFHALEKERATHSSVLAWRIPGTGEPGGPPSMGSHRVGHDWSEAAAAYSLCYTMYSFLICIYLFTFGCAGSLLLTWLSLVVASRGNSSCAAGASLCSGSSCCGSQAVARRLGSCVARRLSCSATCGMFPGQEWNPCPLHWQVDS